MTCWAGLKFTSVPAPGGKPAGAAAAQPVVQPRSAWRADENLRFKNGTEVWPPVFHPVQKLVIHHTAGKNYDPDPLATIRSMYYYHAVTQGWGDIGYNYLITEGGGIYKGRHSHTTTSTSPTANDDTPIGEDGTGRGVTAGHAYGYNSGTVGVAFLGTLTAKDAEPAARSAMESILAWAADAHGIDPLGTSLYTNPTNGTQRFFPNIAGHREVPGNATECPGDWFFPSLPALRQKVATMTQTSFDRTAPAPATNLTAATGKRAITLTWKRSTDPVAGYEVSRSTSQTGPFTSLGTTTGDSYVNSGLTPKKTFWYVVTAFDEAGNRSATVPVKGTSG